MDVIEALVIEGFTTSRNKADNFLGLVEGEYGVIEKRHRRRSGCCRLGVEGYNILVKTPQFRLLLKNCGFHEFCSWMMGKGPVVFWLRQ